MSDRTDWPELTAGGFDSAFTVPKHPKPNSLRARVSHYGSAIKDGVPLPCCYLYRFSNRQHFLTSYRVESDLYFATQLYNQSVISNRPDENIHIWRWDPTILPGSGFRNRIEWSGWVWNRFAELWVVTDWRIQGQFGQFPWNSPLEYLAPGTSNWELLYTAGIQCNVDTSAWAGVDLPDEGPDGYPWPPAFDEWWTDQF